MALLSYRTTPILGGKYSPSELLMNRLPRNTIPTTVEQRKPRVPDPTEVREKDKKEKERQKQNYDSHHGVRKQRPLISGEMIWLPDRNQDEKKQTRHCTDTRTVCIR